MRIFGLIGLLLALVIVGLLARKQFAPLAAPSLPPVPEATAAPTAPGGTAKDQSRQIQQQYKQAVDAALQQPRKMPDDN